MEGASQEMTIREVCDKSREDIQKIADLIFIVNQRHSSFNGEQEYPNQHSESHVNFMLCYRHLEDAKMRLGKVIQAQEGGKSIYDKK